MIPGNGGDDPRADAISLLNKLVRRSFIEVNCWGGSSIWVDHVDFVMFKVHDVMRDLAFYILNDSGIPPAN